MAENVALANQLQAIQLGASLYERAVQNKRLQEQLQLQTADQLMRQRQADLQNKIQSNAYAQALQEQSNQEQEFDQFQKFNQDISNFLNSQDFNSPIPALPKFKSKVFNQQAIQAVNGLEQYSTRARLAKSRANYDNIVARNAEELQGMGFDVINENGLVNKENYNKFLPNLQLSKLTPEVRTAFVQTDNSLPFEERVARAQDIVYQQRASQPTAMMKSVNFIVENRKKLAEMNGQPLTQEQIQRITSAASEAGGKLKPLDQNLAKKVEGEFASLESVDFLLDRISNFEKQNKKNFTDFIGVIPSSIQSIESKIQTEKDPTKQNALSILADFYGVINGVGRTTSGLTVTEGERNRLEKQIGSSFDKNSLIKLKSFRDLTERSVRGSIIRNLDRDIPDFAERYVSTPFGTTTFSLYNFDFQKPEQKQQEKPSQVPSIDMSALDAEIEKRKLNLR